MLYYAYFFSCLNLGAFMKKSLLIASVIAVASMPLAHADYASDSRAAHGSTKTTKTVNYQCQNGKNVRVTYGFNAQKLPTYAQANIDGKNRFLPINLNRSDNVDTVFGDSNNYSIMTDAMTLANHRSKSINIQSASGEFAFKGCSPRR